MNSKLKSPWFALTVLLCVVGSLLPIWSLVRGGGLRGSLNDAGLMVAFWGMSPFVLPLVAAWIARRSWVQAMVVVLVGVAVLFSLTNYVMIQPNQGPGGGTASYFMLPIWQWPMAILGAGLALVVPSIAEEERANAEAAASPPNAV